MYLNKSRGVGSGSDRNKVSMDLWNRYFKRSARMKRHSWERENAMRSRLLKILDFHHLWMVWHSNGQN